MSSQGDLQISLKSYLKELCLTQIEQCYEEHARRAENESLSYEKYLYELVGEEYEVRQGNHILRLLKESKLPLEKSFESFDKKRIPRKVIQVVDMLTEVTFLDRKENVLAFEIQINEIEEYY